MNLSYSNLFRNKLPSNLYLYFYLFFVILVVGLLFNIAINGPLNFMIYFTLVPVIMIVLLIVITILFIIQKEKIIKGKLWKNGTKVDGFIVDVGSLLYRRVGRSRTLF